MSVKMLSMNLAGSKKLSEILQARDLAPRAPHLAEGVTPPIAVYHQDRAGQASWAQHKRKPK